jgi:response regulator of citrate/malate metabolism
MGRKPKEALATGVIEIIKRADRPLTTEDLREKTGASWNTLQKYLERAAKESKITHYKKIGKRIQHLWFKK